MAQRPFNQPAADELGRNLSALRSAKGDPSYGSIFLHLAVEAGLLITEETVRKYHVGRVDPNVAPVEVLAALADYYGVGLSDLSPVAIQRARNLSGLLERSLRCIPGWDGQERRQQLLAGAAP